MSGHIRIATVEYRAVFRHGLNTKIGFHLALVAHATDAAKVRARLQRHSPNDNLLRKRNWRIQLLGFVSLFLCTSLFGLGSDRSIGQFMHTSWTAKDGAPGRIQALAQTNDGFLWLGTSDGLYRFDGATFERFEPPSWSAFPILNVHSLFAVPRGDLWISFNSGVVSVLRDRTVTNYTAADGVPAGLVLSLAQDREGTMWASTTEGLARLESNRWKEVGKDWNFPGKVGCGLFVDRHGTLWVAVDNTILFLPPGTRQFLPAAAHIGQMWQFAEAANGKLWMAETSRAVRPAPLNTGQEPPDDTEIILGSVAIFFDPDGALWITTLGDGMRRARAPQELRGRIEKTSTALESFTSKDGLSDDYVGAMLQDREGNIWVGTHKGLDRFRKTNLIPVALPISPMQAALAAGDDGDVWGSSIAGLAHIHQGRAYALPLAMFRHGIHISSRSPDGIIWWIGQYDVYRSEKGRFSRFPLPKELSTPFNGNVQIAEDRSHRLWMAAAHNGLFRLKNSEWTKFDAGPDIEKLVPIVAFTDWKGSVWFTYAGGTIAIFNGDTIERVFSPQQSPVGSVRAISGDNEHVWVGGEQGLAVFLGDHFQQVSPADAPHFQAVWGIVRTPGGDVWLSENRGVIHIPSAEVRKVLGSPDYRVTYELFDSSDGLPGTFRERGWAASKVIQATDGQIWFAASDGIARLDPANISRNSLPPPVLIRSVRADGKPYPSRAKLALPALTGNLQISYSGLSLSAPEHVYFRYKLEGADKDWQDAGTRREAFYTNLRPGEYRFRVIACNNDGLWNEAGATWDFSVAPAWFQTAWFEALWLTAVAAAVALVYNLRVRHVTSRLRERMYERMAEREQIARDLHDTFFQGIQGLLLRFHAATSGLPKDDPTRRKLEETLQQSDQVMREGRELVLELRTTASKPDDLTAAFAGYGKQMQEEHPCDFKVVVNGNIRPLHPVVCEEISRIGKEALINAFRHSAARVIEAELNYEPNELRVRFRDDGGGIDPNILKQGSREGHWGLPGMRERARKIGAHLDIWSRAGVGTEIELRLAANVAFTPDAPAGVAGKLRNFWSRTNGAKQDRGAH